MARGLWLCLVIGLVLQSSRGHRTNLVDSTRFTLGEFRVTVTQDEGAVPSFSIVHGADPDHVVWSTTGAFLARAIDQTKFNENSGNFQIEDQLVGFCSNQTVDRVWQPSLNSLHIAGAVCGGPFNFTLRTVPLSRNQLQWEARMGPPALYNRTVLLYNGEGDSHVYGFGAQYSAVNWVGERLELFSREQGVGRGDQPVTSILNRKAHYAGGSPQTTYTFVPYYLTSGNRAVYFLNSEYTVFDLTMVSRSSASGMKQIRVEVSSNNVTARVIYAGSPADVLAEYTLHAGRMKPLPKWLLQGAVVGLTGGSTIVPQLVSRLKATAPNLPIAAVWMQDWSGIRDFGDRTGLWWNWVVDKNHYQDWPGFIAHFRAQGIRVLNYINPMLVNISAYTGAPDERNLLEEAARQGFLVRVPDADSEGTILWQGYNGASLIDLTNPQACDWYKGVILGALNVLNNSNKSTYVSGFMLDFGEALPMDAILFNSSAVTIHNRYPVLWHQLATAAFEEVAELQPDSWYFSRSGFTTSPGHASSFWLGDQLVSFDGNDGLYSAVRGFLSTGFSGFSLQHTDIGGYTGVNYPPLVDYSRSQELLLRWIEMAAFTPVFRTHPGSKPEQNAQVYSNNETASAFSVFAQVFARLAPYRIQLMEQAAGTGIPLVRHLWLQFPHDTVCLDIDRQFMLGPDLVVAPVLAPKQEVVQVYLPSLPGSNQWVHLFNNETRQGGAFHTVSAPLGTPAVFHPLGSALTGLLADAIQP